MPSTEATGGTLLATSRVPVRPRRTTAGTGTGRDDA